MRLRRIQIHLSILAVIASIAGSVLASSTATITGLVTDPQGAFMAGVKVEATNVETNLTSASNTDSEGWFVISNLPPGRYRMTIQKQGFQTIVKPDVVIHVQDVVTLNFSMQVGSITQSVTIEGGAPLVQIGSAEEFRVHTNGYEAQFGNASGGVINAITRSGGNQFHGRAFSYFRVNRFDAVPKFTTTKPEFDQQRPGGYFSGPIKKDRLFFFGGFEYLNADQTAIVTSPLEVCAPPATRDPVTRNDEVGRTRQSVRCVRSG